MTIVELQENHKHGVGKFILYSTVLMLFSDGIHFNAGSITLYVAYIIIVVNLTLLAFMGNLWLPRGVIGLLVVITVSGVVGFMRGTGSVESFAKDVCGIIPNALYACAFMRFIKFDIEWFFKQYARVAYYVAILGFVLLPLHWSVMPRLHSVMQEASSFCVVCLPAAYYYADEWQRKQIHGRRFFVLLLAVLLTLSSVGFMGLLLGLYLFGTRYRIGKFIAPGVVIAAGMLLYSTSTFFQARLDDTIRGITTADLQDVNISSYGVAVSAFVTQHVFEEHPIIGGGLGSYVVAHDLYSPLMPGNEIFVGMGFGDLAKWDASSLLLRIIAEFGSVGVIATIWFLWHFYPRRATPIRRRIAVCMLLYVFMKFLRSGVYFNPEEWLFFVSYAVNAQVARWERRQRKITAAQPLAPVPTLDAGLPA